MRNIVDSYISAGCTANLCATDLSKAFDKVNHNTLFIKLMNRHIPVELLNILHFWSSACYVSVKWFDACSKLGLALDRVRSSHCFFLQFI